MKVSIENFKSISKVHNFEIKPMNVLSGINSSGKSSFVQMLRLIKETLVDSATNKVFSLGTNSFETLVKKQNTANKISFEVVLNNSEITFPDTIFGDRDATISVSYQSIEGKLFVSDFLIHINATETDTERFLKITYLNSRKNYNIEVSNPLFFVESKEIKINGNIDFVAMVPQIITKNRIKYAFKLDWIKDGLTNLFNSTFYLGPIRQKPEIAYREAKITDRYVGEEGEFTAQILKDLEDEDVEFFAINKERIKTTLIEAVQYWLCKEFNMAEKVYSEKNNDSFRIYLEDRTGLKVNIKHVGYGVSQVLPIIVQGLIMPEGGILIIEQPEIHLHPKIQSLLYDFLYSLSLLNKKVIVETHSSHFITRMRRRIAEDDSNEMDDRINLTFIEDDTFRNLELDDYGTILNYYPDDFIEQPAKEMEAIIKAQIQKRKKNG